MGRRKKSKRRGVTGRTWKREDSPTLMPSYNLAPMAPLTGIPVPQKVDPTGMLTVINPDLGTKNGHRYCSARCGCGCKMIVEVRVTHFRAGKASCPTRRKEQRRLHMVGKEHIEKMKLLGRMLDAGAALPSTAITAGLEYARRLATDAKLQADVRATYKADLAARDFKRAAQVMEQYGKQKEPVKRSPNSLLSTPSTPAQTAVTSLPPYESMPSSVFLERHALIDSKGRWTPRGRAWLKTRPPIAAVPVFTPMVREVTPVKKQEIEVAIPYEQTDAGYYALQTYWNENKKAPPDNFDLKQWFAVHRKKPA